MESLSDKRIIPPATLEQYQEDVSVKQNELKEAEAELRMVEAYRHATIVKEMAIAKNQVEQAEGDLNKLLAGNWPERIEAIEAVINALLVRKRRSAKSGKARR